MKYLKKFENHAAYEAAESSLILPNVSLCVSENEVHYKPYVAPIRVSGVSLNKNVLELNTEATEILVATVVPNNAADKSVTWSSSDSNIATVTQGGVVSAVSSGNCVITVITTDGGYTAQCNTTVVSPTPSHEYVDLGLPSGTKWATMNVGATSETDYGNYYQYGKGTAQYLETYNDNIYKGNDNPLAISLDTAAQAWGGEWHMPTKTQFEELSANTTYEWTTIDGINGGKFTAQNGNYVFFPAAGCWNSGSQENVGSYGYYWSSSPKGYDYTYSLYIANSSKGVYDYRRYRGFPVRGVVGQ